MIRVMQKGDRYEVTVNTKDKEQTAGELIVLFESVLTQGISRELLHTLVDGAVSRESEDITKIVINEYQEDGNE